MAFPGHKWAVKAEVKNKKGLVTEIQHHRPENEKLIEEYAQILG